MSRGPAKQFDREHVLERATATFWRHGCEGTGVADLLESMGIGRQSLYDTFGDKRALYIEALRHYHRTRVVPVVRRLEGPGSALENLREVLVGWTSMPGGQPGCGCFIGNTLAELGTHDAEINGMIADYLQALENAFKKALDRARRSGELQSELPTRDLARVLVNTVQGLALVSKLNHDPARAKSVIRTALAMLEGR